MTSHLKTKAPALCIGILRCFSYAANSFLFTGHQLLKQEGEHRVSRAATLFLQYTAAEACGIVFIYRSCSGERQ
jgi:hypothetical protein